MIEKIKNLKWYFQLAILVGIASLLYLGVYYTVTGTTREEIAALNEQVSALQAKNEAARIATQRINEFRSLYAAKSQEYDELKVLLPEEREITNVLQGLQTSAGESRLSVMRFSPREDALQEGIMAKPVEVEVDSNFSNLRLFFDKMAKLPRIVSITNFNLTQLDKQTAEKTLHARFLLTAYYAAPENMTAAPVPGAPPVPGQPVPPPAAPPVAPPPAK